MVIIISGTPASGKSSVSKTLAKKFPKSAYIPVDDMRAMVVGGNILPWEDKFGEQYKLIEKNFLALTENFLEEGYVVIIDDIIGDEAFKKYQRMFKDVYGFLLLPTKEELKKRDLGRDPEGGMHHRIDALYPYFADTKHDALEVIDSTNQTLEETVNEIFEAVTDGKKF